MIHLFKKIGAAIRNYRWRTNPAYRWDNGGKEIYEKIQNDPEFMQSKEYQVYMSGLE